MPNRNGERRSMMERRTWWVISVSLVLAVMAVVPPRAVAQVSTTTVQGAVYRADGTPASGTLLISWSAFTTPQNQAVAAGSLSTAIGADGFVSVNLTPNAAALPAGSYYTAVYHLSDGTVNKEYWVVPASGTASIASVRAQLEPSAVAVQSVTPEYVNSAVESISSSYLPLAGGSLTGPLTLSADPTSGAEAATKHYADQLAALSLPLAGGTLSGPLNAQQMEGALYAEHWQSGTATNDGMKVSLAECETYPYACQVVAPATYAQTEAQPWGGSFFWSGLRGSPSASAPMGCIRDDRWGAPQWICNAGIDPASINNPEWMRFSSGPSFVQNVTWGPQAASSHTGPGMQVQTNLLAGGRSFSPDQMGSTSLSVGSLMYTPTSFDAVSNNFQGYSNGDHIGILEFDTSYGGIDTGQDEGNEDAFWHEESGSVFEGTLQSITAQSGTSYPQPCTAPCNVLSVTTTQGAANQIGARLEMIDLTHADSSGYISSFGNITNGAIAYGAGADWDSSYGDSVYTTTTASTTSVIGPETVTGYQVVSNPNGNIVIVTVVSNSFAQIGSPVKFTGLTHATFLNNQVFSVIGTGATSTQFEVQCLTISGITCPVTSYTTDSGTATAQANIYPAINVTVPVTNASGFSTSKPACIFEQGAPTWDCEPLTAVSTASNTITFAVLDAPYSSGDYVAQGGLTGYGFTTQADWVGGATGAQGFGAGYTGLGNVIRPVFPIMFNVPGNAAYVMSFNNHATRAYGQMGSGGTVTATVSGGSVTSCTASGGSGYLYATQSTGGLVFPPQLTYTVNTGATPPVLYITGTASGGSLNGCAVANRGSGITSITVAVTPSNPYAIYPMTHTQNVWNPATGALDGSSIATDQLMGTFSTGDKVEIPHYFNVGFRGLRTHSGSYQFAGKGVEGRSAMIYGRAGFMNYDSNANSPLLYQNFPAGGTPYVIGQGQMMTPYGYVLSGPFANGLELSLPSFGAPNGTNMGAVDVNCSPYCASWNAWSQVLTHQNAAGGEDVLAYKPSTSAWQWTSGSTKQGGQAPYCTVGLAGAAGGGLSFTCNGITSKFDTSGNLALPGSLRAQGGLSGATINGEITVDGVTYPSLNAAWNAAVQQANTSGQNQTIHLGPGTFTVSATMNEPANGACVSVLGSGGTTMNADSPQIATTLTVPASLGGDVFFLGNTAQAQGCTFKDLNLLAQGNATHGFELQWFRGALLDNITANDTTAEGILLGEENTAAGHQANFLVRNTTVSYSSAVFTPASRPAYGIHIEKTAIDSDLDKVVVRNALTAAIYNEGTGNTGYGIHGFGYPYTCTTAPCINNASSGSAANASYATSYVIYDTGGAGSVWTDTYVDSPAVAGFYVGANGIAIHGGHIQWPDLTSFPAANLIYVAPTVTNNLLVADVDCLGMGAGVNWITYAGTSGNPPTYASIHHLTGCGNYYQALEPANVTGFSSGGANINDPTGAVPRVWSTPVAAASSYPAYSAQMYTGYQGDAFQAHFSGSNPFFNVTYQGTIRSNGGLALSTVINTASTLTLTAANRNVVANAASGTQTLTLPSCYTPLPDKASPTGLELTIIKSDTSANAVTLQTVSSQNINYNGVSAQTLAITTAGKRTLVCGPDYNWYAY